MSQVSPNNIFCRLEALKEWQKQQQDRLRRQQSQQEEFLTNEQKRMCEALGALATKSPQHPAGLDSAVQGVCILATSEDEADSAPTTETPRESERPVAESPEDDTPKPKRPFLRKGSGLQRYRMTSNHLQPKPTRKVLKHKDPHNDTPQSDFKIHKPILKHVGNKQVQSWGTILANQNQGDARSPEYLALLQEMSAARLQNSGTEESYGQKAFEKALEHEIRQNKDVDELKIFEFLEQKATNSSFCSTSSIVAKLVQQPIKCTPVHSNNHNSQGHVTFSATNDMTSDSESSLNSDDICDNFRDESAWSDTDADRWKTRESTSVSAEISRDLMPTRTTVDSAVNTDQQTVTESSELLRLRLEQLEKEIRVFRDENAKVQSLKSRLESEHRDFEKRKSKLLGELEAEHAEAQALLDEERRRLQRDRTVYERYLRESKNRPSRKERDEINLLKTQLSNAREEMKLKDSRHGAAQARYRNQIKTLETKVSNLKGENESLRKQNGKLQAAQKLGKPTDTRMLHQINRNLSRLACNAKARRPDESGDPDQKENDANVINVVSHEDPGSIEREYQKTFGCVSAPESDVTEREEKTLPDGSKQVRYSNGNVKNVSADGKRVLMKYYNGDVKETNLDNGTIKYYYSESETWHTTHADGDEVFQFTNGQIERINKDGTVQVIFPDGSKKFTALDGTDEVQFCDGTTVLTKPTGEKLLKLPNGQKEIHTHEHKRREYPDGTVKLVYADGVQETRYADGRIRLKDKHGKLLMDSALL